MTQALAIKGAEAAPKSARSSMETLILTQEQVGQWELPPFQRPLRVNEKVLQLVEDLKTSGGILPGILTLGVVGERKEKIWIVDGQHRIQAFIMSELPECIADVRICHFDTMAEMANEFVLLNSRLVNMRPDDILRGLEGSIKALRFIREACEFVGYGMIRRGSSTSALVSMSAVIRAWTGSFAETPAASSAGKSAAAIAEELDQNGVQNLVAFLQIARSAWGSDPEYYRLWSALNITMCMWIYRRLVMHKDRYGNVRYIVLNQEQFRKCLMAVSANKDYLDWLVGRNMNDRDRSPCYARLKAIFMGRLREEAKGDRKPSMPQPAWSSK